MTQPLAKALAKRRLWEISRAYLSWGQELRNDDPAACQGTGKTKTLGNIAGLPELGSMSQPLAKAPAE